MTNSGPALAAHHARKRAERIAMIEEDLALGIEPDRIAADNGVKRDSLGRFLDRAGRHDLASRFYVTTRPKNNYSRGRTCTDCDAPIQNTSIRCRSCANSRRAHEMWESRTPWRVA